MLSFKTAEDIVNKRIHVNLVEQSEDLSGFS